MQQLIPNAKAQFIDSGGQPLASGTVGFYFPGTLNPKPTFQDAAGTIANTNPVQLDSRGQAIIWGSGVYRQIVKDASGVTIWDQITEDPNAGLTGNITDDVFVASTDFTPGTTTQLTLTSDPGSVANMWVFFDAAYQDDSQIQSLNGFTLTFNSPIPVGVGKVTVKIGTTIAIGTPGANSVTPASIQRGGAFRFGAVSIDGSASINSTFIGSGLPSILWLNQVATAASATLPEIGGQFTVSSNVGTANKTTAYKIGLTASALGGANSSNVYGFNAITQGYGGTYLVTGIESDVNNIGADAPDLASPTSVYGFVGVAAGNFLSSAGLWLTNGGGGNWNVGVAVTNAKSVSYFENATSDVGVQIAGHHSVAGIDMRSGTMAVSLALPNNVSMAQNSSGGVLRNLAYIDNTDRLLLSNPDTVIYAQQSILPFIDNTYQLGGASNRWTVVYAATGTINTSDENHKTDIEPISDTVLDAWADVDYCQFRYRDAVAKKDAGTARLHVGVIAQRVKAAFEKHNLDPFAYGVLCRDDIEGGEIYGVRYEEALVLEAALMRREIARIKTGNK